MGLLGDRARQQSKFLMLDKGDSVVVQYVGFKFVTNRQDPTKEDVLYEFKEQGSQKFWTNGSARVMRKMDHAQVGEWVRISREKAIKQDGMEDTSKSKYVVEVLGDKPPAEGQGVAPAAIEAPGASQGPTNGNPGMNVDPAEIKDPWGES